MLRLSVDTLNVGVGVSSSSPQAVKVVVATQSRSSVRRVKSFFVMIVGCFKKLLCEFLVFMRPLS